MVIIKEFKKKVRMLQKWHKSQWMNPEHRRRIYKRRNNRRKRRRRLRAERKIRELLWSGLLQKSHCWLETKLNKFLAQLKLVFPNFFLFLFSVFEFHWPDKKAPFFSFGAQKPFLSRCSTVCRRFLNRWIEGWVQHRAIETKIHYILFPFLGWRRLRIRKIQKGQLKLIVTQSNINPYESEGHTKI